MPRASAVANRPRECASACRRGRRPTSSSTHCASRRADRHCGSVARLEHAEYARIAAVEADHWWYRSTRALVGDLLQPWLGHAQVILDAGCGPGGNGAWLRHHGTVVGVDVSPEALEHVRRHHAQTIPVQGDVEALPFGDASFDVVVAVTVLYAVPDDAGAVRELARVTKPGGAIALVEPAFESLRRAHDATVHGRRRYRTRDLEALAGGAGLATRRATYAYSFLAPPAYALARLDRVRTPRATRPAEPPSDVERRSLDRVFAPLARVERRALAHRDLPVGTSVLLLATRD